MSLKPGDAAPDFKIIDTNGKVVTLKDLKGKKIWMCLYRVSACPLCNMQVGRVKKQLKELTSTGMEIISVFESDQEEIKKYAGTQAEPGFPIYVPHPDTFDGYRYAVYSEYGSVRFCPTSVIGLGAPYHMVVDCKMYPAFFGYGGNPMFGCPLMCAFPQLFCGSRAMTMPTDVLIENGKIVKVSYGNVPGSHIPMDEVMEFAGVKAPANMSMH